MRRVRTSFAPAASPAAVRRRARRWTTLAVAALLSPYAALALAAAGWYPSGVAIVLALLAIPTGLIILSETCEERPPSRTSGPRLTARTLTGERTVDLSALSTVHLLTYFSRSGVSERVLLVRDANGIRLGLKSTPARAALRRALDRPSPQPRVSRAARAHLGLTTDRGPLRLHTITTWLAMMSAILSYFLPVLALADRIPQ